LRSLCVRAERRGARQHHVDDDCCFQADHKHHWMRTSARWDPNDSRGSDGVTSSPRFREIAFERGVCAFPVRAYCFDFNGKVRMIDPTGTCCTSPAKRSADQGIVVSRVQIIGVSEPQIGSISR